MVQLIPFCIASQRNVLSFGPIISMDGVRISIIGALNSEASTTCRGVQADRVGPETIDLVRGLLGLHTTFHIQINWASSRVHVIKTVRIIHVIITAPSFVGNRTVLGNRGMLTSSLENVTALIFSPEIVFAQTEVDIVPPRVLGHGQRHFGKLGVQSVVRNHRFVSENKFFEMTSGRTSSASVFKGDFGRRRAVEVVSDHGQNVVSSQIRDAIIVFKLEGLAVAVFVEKVEKPRVEEHRVHDLVDEGGNVGFVISLGEVEVVLVEDRISDEWSVCSRF